MYAKKLATSEVMASKASAMKLSYVKAGTDSPRASRSRSLSGSARNYTRPKIAANEPAAFTYCDGGAVVETASRHRTKQST